MQMHTDRAVSRNTWIARRAHKVFLLMMLSPIAILQITRFLEPPAQWWVAAAALATVALATIPLTFAVIVKRRYADKQTDS